MRHIASAVAGTALAPITVRGVPDAGGNLPVISGENATTRLALDYTNEVRGVIKIGTASPDVLPAVCSGATSAMVARAHARKDESRDEIDAARDARRPEARDRRARP